MVQAYAREFHNQKESENLHPEQALQAATERLGAALNLLERKLKSAAANDDGDKAALIERENVALKREQEKLSKAVVTLQEQYDDLHKVAAAIYGKLENSIKRLTQIIEN